jgi:predicted nucleotidyltransferase
MIDLSKSTEPRLAVASEVLSLVSAVAKQHGVELMVVGATARDILSAAIVGTPPARATADVNVALGQDWTLLQRDDFTLDDRDALRVALAL